MRTFNLFKALRLERAEIRHSNWLAFLLSPNEAHGQGTLFLDALCCVTNRICKNATQDSVFEVHGEDGANIDREWGGIDVLVRFPSQRKLIAIEQKLEAGEGRDQLAGYAKLVDKDFQGWTACFLYLTPDSRKPSDSRWHAIGHDDLVTELKSCVGRIDATAPPAFATVLDHYFQIFHDRKMTRLARGNRSPVALAEPAASDPSQGVAKAILDAATGCREWSVIQTAPRLVRCIPRELLAVLPPIGHGVVSDPRGWFSIHYEVFPTQNRVGRFWRASVVNPTAMTQRDGILTALQTDQETGVRYKNGQLADSLNGDTPTFSGQTIFRWGNPSEIDFSRLQELIARDLTDLTRSGRLCAAVVASHLAGKNA